MQFRRHHERWIEELYVHLENGRSLTSSGENLTLPAAVADLRGWIVDQRTYAPIQYRDWQQVISDFTASADNVGFMLRQVAPESVAKILKQLGEMFFQNSSGHWIIEPNVRQSLSGLLTKLETELSSTDALIAGWRDLVAGCQGMSRSPDDVAAVRDTLWALADRRNLDLGKRGVFSQLASVITDNPDAVHAELDAAANAPHEFRALTYDPTGVSDSERIAMCENILSRDVERGDCIVWLRLAPASLPRYEVGHGQVTFYNASYLTSALRDPANVANLFTVVPSEVLTFQGFSPVLSEDEVLWEDDFNMVYARVCLANHEIHKAIETARTLVKALIAVNRPTQGTWQILSGSLGFIDGEWASLFGWGPKDEFSDDMYYPQNDSMDRDIELMTRHGRTLTAQSMHDLRDALSMSAALKAAVADSPHAVVMAAVRAIEHVNIWVTRGGEKTWVAFASNYLREWQARVWFVRRIGRTMGAAMHMQADPSIDLNARAELQQLDAELRGYLPSGHEIFNVRKSAEHIERVTSILERHWLARDLNDIAAALRTPAKSYARLNQLGIRFDIQLRRLSRLRNAAIHGGPISDDASASVEPFASMLAHRSLDEAIYALLSGQSVAHHMTDFRVTEHGRWVGVRGGDGIGSLFAEPEM
jgi:hypothetical protein